MRAQLRPALVLLLVFTVITGILYPLLVTGWAQAFFPYQADGSIIVSDGQAHGSVWIGQPFDAPEYFWGRLSATAPFPYNATASSGSNFGPSNPALIVATQVRIAALRAADPAQTALVPVDLATASGSGLDPHISIAAARYQIPRVARVRGLGEAQVEALVARCTEGRQFGILGEPRVHVLKLNLALDEMVRNR